MLRFALLSPQPSATDPATRSAAEAQPDGPWLGEVTWNFPTRTNKNGPAQARGHESRRYPMTTTQATCARGGKPADVQPVRWALDVNVRVARRMVLNAAKRADELMQAGEPDGAEKHRELMAIAVKLEELGGAS